jgi:nucleoside-diphosphate kinase
MLERTLVLLKPDAVQRGLVGPILARFEQKGLQIVGLKLRQFPRALLERHYEAHKERPFYPSLLKFMTSGPVVAVAIEGKDAVEVVRKLIGKTNARQAEPGTIRGDLGMSFSNNLVHGSDGADAAKRELALFFPDAGELVAWTPATLPWTYSVEEELKST